MNAKKKSSRRRYEDNPLAYVSDSPIHGRGLFARRPIAADEYIGSYHGRRTQKNGMHVLWIWNDRRERWEGIDGVNEMRFLNHADEPNADWWGADLYAIRPIAKGEEITFDYGWDSAEEED
jgi:uncharacterized protein